MCTNLKWTAALAIAVLFALGQAGLDFIDKSTLHVGPDSSVRLDRFVYDPNKGGGAVVIDAAKGAFRFSTGAQGKNDVKIKTPHGAIGVRG
jgi:hypothetical protein